MNYSVIRKREAKLFLVNLRDSMLYFFKRSRKPPICVKKIVFICKGNICRSVFAEYLMRSKTNDESLSIESCGLDPDIGAESPMEARAAAKMYGLDMDDHLSKGLENCDISNADLILPMELWQYSKVAEIFPQKNGNIRLLREFTPFPENLLCNISDPFGQNLSVSFKCFQQIKRAVDNIELPKKMCC
jgi:protein-tyrosine phosphatase